MRYWIRHQKQSLGPFTPEEIQRHPEVGEGTLVLPEGKTRPDDWVRLRQVPELIALYARQVPPPHRQQVPEPPPEEEDRPRPGAPRPPPLPMPNNLAASAAAGLSPEAQAVVQRVRSWGVLSAWGMGLFGLGGVVGTLMGKSNFALPFVLVGLVGLLIAIIGAAGGRWARRGLAALSKEDAERADQTLQRGQIVASQQSHANSAPAVYHCAPCGSDFTDASEWMKHRWEQHGIAPGQVPQAQAAQATGGLISFLGLLLFVGYIWYSWRLTQPPNLTLPEIAYQGKTGDFVDCHDFVWRDGSELTFKVRFRKEFAFGSFRLHYEARDQAGSVLIASGGAGSWGGGEINPNTSYEQSIYLGRDKASRTRKIIFSAESESMFPGLFPGVTRH